mmetsp:Transcript_31413/g.83605  ORF Transcript_31413/g.83605 Transcript_31413/m.83605 type:complete len:650 (-) Transcript_31413:269-2218(-)|eukprot:CAMPEP_0194510074 /NCGR_PEP_ID=MMETSP0253-20130528/41391_1 /TAXON_ID=2966 /ORGANISM="Noctiluca scintillans" /LENGTH=649 /DNA_ID=CAMNT_0039353293 /DNA_START=70 /DNA_END=2019 /DNA_ORIENTATION=+
MVMCVDPLHEFALNQYHPPSFYCPISKQFMHDPVVLSDGHSYERRHIEQWLQEHETSPVCDAPLAERCMFPNHALRNAIEEYLQQVFSAHRRAIRRTIRDNEGPSDCDPRCHADLLRTVDSLMQCSVLVNADLSIEHVLGRIMNEAKELIGAEAASVFLVDSKGGELYSTVNSTGVELRVPVSASIAGHTASTGEPLIILDAYCDARFNRSVDLQTGFRTCSVLCLPIKTRKHGVIGVAQLINKTNLATESGRPSLSEGFTADDLHLMQVFVSQVVGAIANSGSLEETFTTPKHDDEVVESRRLQESTVEFLESALGQWEVDICLLSQLTGGKPLSTLCVWLFDRLGFVTSFDLDRQKIGHFFTKIEQGYDDTIPYHNGEHAASVVHVMNTLMDAGGIAAALSRGLGQNAGNLQLERMGCILAAAIHDFEHLGRNNDFLSRTRDDRAVLYNDRHVNENHHVAAAFSVMRRPDCNFLERMPEAEYCRLRQIVIGLVLSTDMADNTRFVTAFKGVLKGSRDREHGQGVGVPCFLSTQEDALLALQVAIKCADVGHLSLSWPTHLQWVRRLQEEFFSQGDLERDRGLPVSFLMDRFKPGVLDSQVGFFDFVALPLFETLADAFPSARPMCESVRANRVRWAELEEKKATGCT